MQEEEEEEEDEVYLIAELVHETSGPGGGVGVRRSTRGRRPEGEGGHDETMNNIIICYR